jgi:hypothetical protein
MQGVSWDEMSCTSACMTCVCLSSSVSFCRTFARVVFLPGVLVLTIFGVLVFFCRFFTAGVFSCAGGGADLFGRCSLTAGVTGTLSSVCVDICELPGEGSDGGGSEGNSSRFLARSRVNMKVCKRLYG